MQIIGYGCLILAMVVSMVTAGLLCFEAWQGQRGSLPLVEKGQALSAGLMTMSCVVLLRALLARDFSFAYVAEYTDSTLPLFYTITAFWAGQAGSLLFWAWVVSLYGLGFAFTRGYRLLSTQTKVYFWLFFLTVQAFFLLLLTGVSNPFVTLSSAPPDGQGLNPLLQNVGMVIHPPLLFLGYAGFTIPACLALASWFTREKHPWMEVGHNWTLTAWILLTAGIILGAWWSYLELGWGGYWAWDPVENASLIPWFSSTAFIHTAVIERRRGALPRSNVFLIALTLVLCFFATYLVRSGVVQSLHAFGDGGVGQPLLLFILASLIVAGLVLACGPRGRGRALGGILSRQGFLVLGVWLLLAIGAIVLLGTMWPVISLLWDTKAAGVTQAFYNAVCLPLFAVLALLLVFAPWLGWKEGTGDKKFLAMLVGLLVVTGGGFWVGGVRLAIPLLSAGAAAISMASFVLLFIRKPGHRSSPSSWGAYGAHLGFALMVLGVAFSGPYQEGQEAIMEPGQSINLGRYEFVYRGTSDRLEDSVAVQEARVEVMKDGRPFGVLTPQSRRYRKFEHPHSEVSTLFGLGDEVYATIHDVEGQKLSPLKVSIHPLVNWVWIGGVLMCTLPFLALRRFLPSKTDKS